MAKKKSPSDSRRGSRHKPRRTVAYPPRLYEMLVVLAERNQRPINWEARLILERPLKEAGLWPPPDDLIRD
jgi:hypothetical protein